MDRDEASGLVCFFAGLPLSDKKTQKLTHKLIDTCGLFPPHSLDECDRGGPTNSPLTGYVSGVSSACAHQLKTGYP